MSAMQEVSLTRESEKLSDVRDKDSRSASLEIALCGSDCNCERTRQ